MSNENYSKSAYTQAPLVVNQVKDHAVEQQIKAFERAEGLRKDAEAAIKDLSRAVARLNTGKPGSLTAPLFPKPVSANVTLDKLTDKDWGNISAIGKQSFTPSGNAAGAIKDVQIDDLKTFSNGLGNVKMPSAPDDPRAAQFPLAPTLTSPELPAKPTIVPPTLPTLEHISIPSFSFTPLSPFSDTDPQFKGVLPNVSLADWQEDEYQPILMDEMVEVLRRMWAGGTGLPPAVEQALWERAASREDVAIARDVSAAHVEFSSRGFSLPPGALVARVDAVREEGALRKQSLGRDILIKVADTHIENLRFATTQAIAAENVLVGLFSQKWSRALEIRKMQLDAGLALFNAQISLYNTEQGARQHNATMRRLELEERAQDLQVMRLELEGELAKGQVNEQRIKIYAEQFKALSAQIDLYTGEMKGAEIEAGIQRLELDKYKAGVEAEAEVLRADKLRFDAYESQIKGEVAKVSLIESQARAYGAYVSGKSTEVDVSVKRSQAMLAQEDMRLRAFLANLEADKSNLQAQLSAIQAKVSGHEANTRRYTAQAGVETALVDLQIKAYDAQTRQTIAAAEAEVRKYIADMEQMIRAASLQVEGAKSIGQAYSTLAAGAMAGISLSTSMTGSASVTSTSSASDNTNVSYSYGGDVRHDVTPTVRG